jgi:hypothetical protein
MKRAAADTELFRCLRYVAASFIKRLQDELMFIGLQIEMLAASRGMKVDAAVGAEEPPWRTAWGDRGG